MRLHSGLGSALLLISSFAPRSVLSLALEKRQNGQSIGSTVTLDYGTFTGLRNETSSITYFRGIRFADPPIGDLRWRAPVSPPTRHLGNVNATEFAKACIRTAQTTVGSATSEDCLFGNVYIPVNTTTDDKLPVMVYFHAGGFQSGSTHTAPPDLIMQSSAKPLIFATFEYRLGQFGFLGGSQLKEHGNMNAGLLDQRAALRWVQRYIHLFGGDSSQVTIWGQSAGAGSTMFHLIANGGDNEGLFRAAMGDSPSLGFVPAFNETYAEGIYQEFADFAGCSNSSTPTLQCLRSLNSTVLASAGNRTITAHPSTLFVFAPILDGDFIRTRPVGVFSSPSAAFARVPVLYGSNTDEGSKWSAELRDPSANTSKPDANEGTVVRFLQGQYPTIPPDVVVDAISAKAPESGPGGNGLYPLEDFAGSVSLQAQQMYGEARYICTAGMIVAAARRVGVQTAYQFHYDNPHLGSDHGSEMDAFFSPPADANDDDLALFEAMREYWTSFVTDGQPRSRNGVDWAPASYENFKTNGSPRILLQPGGVAMEEVDDTLNARCAFWRGISSEMQT